MVTHYNQKKRREAEFITPPNMLKAKVGTGGLADDILDRAQELLEHNDVDFKPLGELYLSALMNGIEAAKRLNEHGEIEHVFSKLIYPAMQLKANGGMFHYDLVTSISDKLIQYLEVLETIDPEATEIVLAFHTTIRAVLNGGIKGDGGTHGEALAQALDDACYRYFERYPENIQPSA